MCLMANQTQKSDQLIRQTMKINQLMRHKQAISQSIDRNNDKLQIYRHKYLTPKSKNDTEQNGQKKQGDIHYMYFVF